jgi:predicted NUDIX family NTP pyrophosphohydrolase
MAKKNTAGLLLYRRRGELEVFLVHPGGPFWSKKDLGDKEVCSSRRTLLCGVSELTSGQRLETN